MPKKEIHFYPNQDCLPATGVLAFWDETRSALDRKEREIHTIQMGFLESGLIADGYDVFIHNSKHDVWVIDHESGCERLRKEIRPAHNLFRMWKAGTLRT